MSPAHRGFPRQFFKACFQAPLHVSIIYQYNEAVSANLEDLRAKADIKLFEKDDDKEQIGKTWTHVAVKCRHLCVYEKMTNLILFTTVRVYLQGKGV